MVLDFPYLWKKKGRTIYSHSCIFGYFLVIYLDKDYEKISRITRFNQKRKNTARLKYHKKNLSWKKERVEHEK